MSYLSFGEVGTAFWQFRVRTVPDEATFDLQTRFSAQQTNPRSQIQKSAYFCLETHFFGKPQEQNTIVHKGQRY